MDATYRSTQSPYSGASPTQLVDGKLAPEFSAAKAKAVEKDQVLAAALSEYCRLKDDGTAPQIDEFCRRFPTYHKSIQRMIDVEETLDKLDDLDDVQWPDVGSNFMGFDILHELGVGAFARVYLAAEPALGGRLVAVKVAMFNSDEAETLGKLIHPNVVPVHSVRDDPESGMTAVCMPYLGSATLSDVIEQVFQNGVPRAGSAILQAVERREVVGNSDAGTSDADPDKALRRGTYVGAVVRLGMQMAGALVYTHTRGVLHRDLKPSNVLITTAGQPKLLDFNLSCDVETEVNRLGGTLPYMPPEQINDVFLRPFDAKPPTDPRSDLFSLGVILYELLTGELPFGIPPSDIPPVEAGAIYLEAQQSPPRPIQELNPAVESQTAHVIERCLAPDPDRRPANAALLEAELGKYCSLPRRLRRWPSANKKTMVAAGVVTLVMLLSLTAYVKMRLPPDRQLYNFGLKAMANGDYGGAIEYFNQALDLNADEPAIHFARGLCYRATGDHDVARDIEKSRRFANDESESIVQRVYAYSYFQSGQASQATAPYRELVKKYPDDLDLKVNLAYANFALSRDHGTPTSARRQANEILQVDPTCQAAHYIRAISNQRFLDDYELGDPIDVLQDIETALAMGPSKPGLEKMRMRLLARIAKDQPHLHDALVVETKSRLWRLAPDVERQVVESLALSLHSIADDAWFDEVKARCRTTPERTLASQITVPPSEAEIQQFLQRAWD